MDLQGIMLSERSQTKTNTTCYHLYVNSEKKVKHQNRIGKWLLGEEGRGNREKLIKEYKFMNIF